jgi:imidazolonepropionase-like amidohydrolase
MKLRLCVSRMLDFLLCCLTFGQSALGQGSDNSKLLRAAQVLEVRTGTYIKDAAIYVEGERIKAVGPAADVLKQVSASVQVIDLGDATVLPGLIDCHTQLMACIPGGPNAYALKLAPLWTSPCCNTSSSS